MECKICLKKFSNAKAVGAHMKAHFAPLKPRLTESLVVSSSECKICFKKFANAKAVGAHMKSHFAPLRLPKTPPCHRLGTESLAESASESGEEEKIKGHVRKPLTKKLKQILYPEFVAVANSVGRKSESESTREVVKAKQVFSPKTISEYGEFSTEFDVALCLIMLSRDIWVTSPSTDSVSDDSVPVTRKTRYKCEKCTRVFKSPQGLSTHNKIHENKGNGDGIVRSRKKKKIVEQEGTVNCSDGKLQVHECEVCGKVFKSVFGLAGHRRWHLAILKSSDDEIRSSSCKSIDLNLPPPTVEDEEEEEDSIMEQAILSSIA